MRAAPHAHPSEVPANRARAALVRMAMVLLATLMLLAVWRPSIVRAQAKPVPASKAQAAATDTATTTHIVKAGETLWSLSERYYGSGHQWQELARRNALVTTSPKVLLVGMKLRVPAAMPSSVPAVSAQAPVPAIARTPAVAAGSASAKPAGADAAGASTSLAAQTADKSDALPTAAASSRGKAAGTAASKPVASKAGAKVASAAPAPKPSTPAPSVNPAAPGVPAITAAAAAPSSPDRSVALANAGRMSPQMRAETLLTRQTTRIGLVDREDLAAARGKDASTVFLRRIPEAEEVEAQARAVSRGEAPLPRRGEYEAAPFSIDAATIAKGGKLLRRLGAATGGSSTEPQRMMLVDEVEIAAPVGVSLAVGDRLVSVQLMPEKAKSTRVAVPTGVVRVTRVEAGKPVVAVVQSQSGGMMQGQPLFVVQGTAAPVSARATAAAPDDIATSVRWIDATESLPTLQSFVLLGAGSAQGVQAGDEFELRTAPRAGVEGGAGGELIARARVVRVDSRESAAIIVKQERAEIAIGVAARRVARVP